MPKDNGGMLKHVDAFAPRCSNKSTCSHLENGNHVGRNHVGRFTVSFHNFKSQNFKLSVSNPKSKYIANLSVLSQISNCQSLGPKKHDEILKTERTGTGCTVMLVQVHGLRH